MTDKRYRDTVNATLAFKRWSASLRGRTKQGKRLVWLRLTGLIETWDFIRMIDD